MSEWIEHDGKGMPVDGEILVHVRFPDGYEDTHDYQGNPLKPDRADYWSRSWDWMRPGAPLDVEIFAYRVVHDLSSSKAKQVEKDQ